MGRTSPMAAAHRCRTRAKAASARSLEKLPATWTPQGAKGDSSVPSAFVGSPAAPGQRSEATIAPHDVGAPADSPDPASPRALAAQSSAERPVTRRTKLRVSAGKLVSFANHFSTRAGPALYAAAASPRLPKRPLRSAIREAA